MGATSSHQKESLSWQISVRDPTHRDRKGDLAAKLRPPQLSLEPVAFATSDFVGFAAESLLIKKMVTTLAPLHEALPEAGKHC